MKSRSNRRRGWRAGLMVVGLAAAGTAAAEMEPAAGAAQVEVAAGITVGGERDVSWAGWAGWLGGSHHQRRWYWRPEVTAVVVGNRRVGGDTRNLVPLAGAGLRIGIGDFFVGGSLALILNDHRTPELSTRHQFISTAGWHREHVALVYRHISNGSTGGLNDGENLFAVAVYFR